MTNATERASDNLTPGREYTRNLTVKVPVGKSDIGEQAAALQTALAETYKDDVITGYELVVRVFVTAGGEADVGGEGAA